MLTPLLALLGVAWPIDQGDVEDRARQVLPHLQVDACAEDLAAGVLPGAAHGHPEADDPPRQHVAPAQLGKLLVAQFGGGEEVAGGGGQRSAQAAGEDEAVVRVHGVLPEHPAPAIRRNRSG
ncbi:hypothetical protein Z046_16455 [Pseudomonas aeruginosa VRFPA09]|nr:hypothetical protein Z046_16455 [Pseudomonas aeruginosa VRFPA09]